MIVVVFFSFLAFFICYSGSLSRNKNSLAISFFIVTLLQVIHYDYGNDYMPYYQIYKDVVSYKFDFEDVISGTVRKEPGFSFLCYFCEKIGGFFTLVAIISIIMGVAYYRFIKKYVNDEWIPLAFFIYLTSSNFYLLNFSMLRQGLAVSLFLMAYPFIEKKNIVLAFLFVFLAFSVHTTAAILFPFVFWGFLPVKHSKYLTYILGSLFVLLVLNAESVDSIFSMFLVLEDVDSYMKVYGDIDSQAKYGLGFVLQSLPFIVSLYYLYITDNKELKEKRLVALASLGSLIIPFSLSNPMLGRIGIYFTAYTIATVPIVYSYIENDKIKFYLISIFMLLSLYSYYLFFTNSVYSLYYQDFKTIFSVIL